MGKPPDVRAVTDSYRAALRSLATESLRLLAKRGASSDVVAVPALVGDRWIRQVVFRAGLSMRSLTGSYLITRPTEHVDLTDPPPPRETRVEYDAGTTPTRPL